ncbi:MAG: hypothetical protein EXS69_02495 [Candidatus Zambryskibacteria bacterium]|nr:hypothetical protein [Candidatus Zambryskibacteria bacterium]
MIDKQTCKLISRILENLPREMSEDIMQGWIQNPEGLKKFLSGLVPPPPPEDPFEFFYHEKQKEVPGTHEGIFHGYVDGDLLEQHLKETGLISRALSLESEMVKEWLRNPETCPNIVKYLQPCLWGSAQVREPGREREVPYLHYLNELHNDGRWIQQTRVFWQPVRNKTCRAALLEKAT